MSRIRIKNFGPIKEGNVQNDGWIDISKVTVFIGNQGSGKSTIAKLISSFTWMEKALVRGVGDYNKKWFERKNRLRNFFLGYHNIDSYLKTDGNNQSVIDYEGEAYVIKYENEFLTVTSKENNEYPLPQIMYVPAERNFIAYVKTPKELRLSSPSLQEFITEFEKAKAEIKGFVPLPINNAELEYDRLNDTLNLKGRDYKIRLSEASSGFQSLVPLHLVSDYLARSVKKRSTQDETVNSESMSSEERKRFSEEVQEILSSNSFTNEQRRLALSALSSKFNKTAFINIVEEPEQNLFPSSQWQMLKSLLRFNNMNSANKLIMTTHSPYLINYLTLAVKAGALMNSIKDKETYERIGLAIAEIVPPDSTIQVGNLMIYEMNEDDGTIKLLESYKGMPSDENYLNHGIAESNELFAQLLEIQQSFL
jgi:predicted ATPase